MGNPVLVDPATIRATAAEAWIWGYPILVNYRTLHAQALDDADPGYVGGFGVFRHYPQPAAATRSAAATATVPTTPTAPSVPAAPGSPASALPGDDDADPDPDTARSVAWLDLRAEPWVLSVPAGDRYYVLPVHDLDTAHVGSVGTLATGTEAGDHLLAGPDWRGATPAGVRSVVRAATRLVGIVGRTWRAGTFPAAVEELGALQRQYRLRPLHEFTGAPAPEPAPHPVWPDWREEVPDGIEFFCFLDFLLGFFPVLPAEAELRGRLADLGIDGRGEFEPAALPVEYRAEMEHGIADGRAELARAARNPAIAAGASGTRGQLGGAYLARAVGALRGRYGLPPEELWTGGWEEDGAGNRPPNAGDRDYVLRFAPDRLPPARCHWSVTAYGLPAHRPVDNPLDRHSIGDHTPGLLPDPDGGLTLHVRHKRPADAHHSANWLPAPDGPFTLVLRLYGPDAAALDGSWHLPPLTPR